MTETIGQWIRGAVFTALFVSLLTILVPEGAFRRVARLAGGLIFLLAILRGADKVDLSRFEANLDTYRAEIEEQRTEFEKENEILILQSIAEKTQAYISDKAEALGISVSAEVTAKKEENGYSLDGVRILGPYNAELADWIEEELGLDAEKQEWSSG